MSEILENEILDEAKRKKKAAGAYLTWTTGDPDLNIKRFNTAMGTNLDTAPATPGIEAAKDAAAEINDAINADAGSDASSTGDSGADASAAGDAGDAGSAGEGGGDAGGISEAFSNFRALREAKAFIGKLHTLIDTPDEVQIIPQDKIEKAIKVLDPEEEFTIGYITPIDLHYKELKDNISLLKCSQFTGFTGVDYRDADTDDATKAERVAKAKEQIKDPTTHKDEFSAKYDQTNKTVDRYTNENNEPMRTILFYNAQGSIPKVAYFIDLKDGNGFKQIKKADIENEIADTLMANGTLGDVTTDDIHNIIYKTSSAPVQKAASGNAKPSVFSLYTSQIYYLDIPSLSIKLGNTLVEHFKALANAETINEAYLTEKKKRYSKARKVKRYYIRPQNIYCGNKLDILKTLIKLGNENCSIYTLNKLEDNNDVHELTNDDIIYYYDDGLLYDKNHVKVMDYDLYIKHEEERKKFAGEPDINNSEVKDEYSDRIIEPRANVKEGLTEDLYNAELTVHDTWKVNNIEAKDEDEAEEIAQEKIDAGEADDYSEWDDGIKISKVDVEEAFKLDFEPRNVYGETLTEAVDDTICCICGEPIEGYGNNPYPVKEKGRCCDSCNLHFVIPARLQALNNKTEED